jgi:hypothetical protein
LATQVQRRRERREKREERFRQNVQGYSPPRKLLYRLVEWSAYQQIVLAVILVVRQARVRTCHRFTHEPDTVVWPAVLIDVGVHRPTLRR